MNQKLLAGLIRKLFLAVGVFILAGAVLQTLSGCATRSRAGSEAPTETDKRGVSGRVVREIIGKWQKTPNGRDFAEYARYAENTGTFETLEIKSDATVKREILTAVKLYDCPVEDLLTSEGAVIVESETHLNLTFDTGETRHTENCARDKNFSTATKPTTADYQWQVSHSNDGGAAQLCLTQNDETACYRRAE